MAALLTTAGLTALIKIGDYDIWYHLRAGEHFLVHGPLGQVDPFAFSSQGWPMSVQSWLAAVIFHKVHLAGGAEGLVAFNALVVVTVVALVFFTVRLCTPEPAAIPLAAVVLTLVAFAMRFRISVRPHVFEYLCLAAALYLLHLYRTRGEGPLWLLPAIQLAWVNVHGSHVVGLLLPFLFLIGEALRRVPWLGLGRDIASPVPFRRFALAMIATSAFGAFASLLNPTGPRALLFAFDVAGQRTYMENISEWQPLRLELLVGYGVRYTWAFSALLILLASGLAVRRRAIDPVGLLLAGFFLSLAAQGVRLIPEFALASAPFIVQNLVPLAQRLEKGRERATRVGALAAIVLVAAPAWALDRSYQVGLGTKDGIFPERAIDLVERTGLRGNLFNSFAFGDYLVWRTPDRKVFIHGRNEVFPQALYRRFLDAHTSAEEWKRLVAEYDLDYALLEYYLTDYGAKEAMPHLAHDPEWVPLYWDRLAIVYARRGTRNQETIDRLGFRLIRPTRLDFSYLADHLSRGRGPELLAEFSRLAALAPDNEEAWLGLAFVHYSSGPEGRGLAKAMLQKALAIDPRRAMSHSALGLIHLDEQRPDLARAELEAALALDPNDAAARHGLQTLAGYPRGANHP